MGFSLGKGNKLAIFIIDLNSLGGHEGVSHFFGVEIKTEFSLSLGMLKNSFNLNIYWFMLPML